MLAALLIIAVQLPQAPIVPRPVEMLTGAGLPFELSPDTVLITSERDPSIQFLIDLIRHSTGKSLQIYDGPMGGIFKSTIMLQQVSALPEEGYRLFAQAGEMVISYGGSAGLFYAVQTLRQLLPPELESTKQSKNGSWSIPAVSIQDWPRFKWRGMHLDVSRHFFPTEFIKRYIDYLAMNKMNTFHWHLVDDGGWRMQVDKYPKLTSVGAWRVDTGGKWPGGEWNYGALRFIVQRGQGKAYGGYYSKKEIREIVKYAQERHITVVPEIEMPGHSLPALIAYPELSCEGVAKHPEVGGSVTNVYCAGKESTFEFLENVLKETMELFPSKYIHIGADEVWKGHWEKCTACQQRIKDEGLKDENELQSYFVKRMEKFLVANGRNLVGWDEILEGGLAPEATVMSWRGIQGGIDAAKQGHDVVMSPTSHCYFDYPYANISTQSVYGWEPVPDELSEQEAKHILGGQANVWTEWIADTQRVEYMIFPRMFATAEVLWSPKENRDWNDFSQRLMRQFARLDALGASYHIPPPQVEFTAAVFQDSTTVSALAAEGSPFELRYTMDGKDPDKSSPRYTTPIHVTNDMTLAFALVSKAGNVGEVTRVECVKSVPRNETGLVQGLNYDEYGGEWSKVPDFRTLIPRKTGNAANIGTLGNDGENFALRFSGFIKIDQDGVYRFRLGSDDGSYFAIAGAKVVDHDGLHGYNEKDGAVRLLKGVYPVEIGFFEAGGSQNLTLKFQPPGGAMQEVPSGAYLRRP